METLSSRTNTVEYIDIDLNEYDNQHILRFVHRSIYNNFLTAVSYNLVKFTFAVTVLLVLLVAIAVYGSFDTFTLNVLKVIALSLAVVAVLLGEIWLSSYKVQLDLLNNKYFWYTLGEEYMFEGLHHITVVKTYDNVLTFDNKQAKIVKAKACIEDANHIIYALVDAEELERGNVIHTKVYLSKGMLCGVSTTVEDYLKI